MNPYEFASSYLQPYKLHGSEIRAKLCPFCHGGSNNDKWSFGLNAEKKTYNCKRGTCGVAGTFWQLCKHFGEKADREDDYRVQTSQKQFKKPVKLPVTPLQKVTEYLKKRGISQETWERRKVGEYNGLIAFPYYENGEVVLMKFRKAEDYNGQGMKAWREEDGKEVLWGVDCCDKSYPLVIVEGEMDALALDECGIVNVVSVPSGSQAFGWIDNCWDFLSEYEKIILWGDNDNPGKEMVRQIILRLGADKCYTVESKYKDANESLLHGGREVTRQTFQSAKPVPVYGLLNLADVEPLDISKMPRVVSNIKGFDCEMGGFLLGEVSVWTGKAGDGKSTLLGQLLLESVEQNVNVCAYSGELRADLFQYWINLQAAGPMHTEQYYDHVRGKTVGVVPQGVQQKIRTWYNGKFWLYDNRVSDRSNEEAGILKLFSYAAKRYDCKVFLIDNLMTSRFNVADDFYRAQSDFVGELVAFAKTFNVHIHLVAHPHKTKDDKITLQNIAGTGDIGNRVDNAFLVQRTELSVDQCNSIVTILKNRSGGVIGKKVGLMFDSDCKRFWQPSCTDAMNKQYGWEQVGAKKSVFDEMGA